MTWLNVLGIFMMTIGVIILSADMVVRLVTVCRDWYYDRKRGGLIMKPLDIVPNEDEALEGEDGSYACCSCGEDWYFCECPRMPQS